MRSLPRTDVSSDSLSFDTAFLGPQCSTYFDPFVPALTETNDATVSSAHCRAFYPTNVTTKFQPDLFPK